MTAFTYMDGRSVDKQWPSGLGWGYAFAELKRTLGITDPIDRSQAHTGRICLAGRMTASAELETVSPPRLSFRFGYDFDPL